MSLKSKLEAVIYAAEEPVTLAQLAAIFAEEALALKAERAATSAAQPETDADVQPLFDQGFASLSVDPTQASFAAQPEGADEPEAAPASEAPETPVSALGETASQPQEGVASGEPVAETAAEPSVEGTAESKIEATPGESAAEGASAADAEADLKRQARQRDREVRSILQDLIDEIASSYAADDRGIEIREIAGGYRMATKPECHDAVRQFIRSLKPPLKLSLPALETLAVVAYKQPVTAPEVSEIRGVESAGTLGSLLSRKLIATAGRKQVVGRPILYKTTREFLLRFGLKDVSELPSMEEFEKMAAIELAEPEAADAEAAAAEASAESLEDTGEEVMLNDSFERTEDESAATPTEGASAHNGAETAPDHSATAERALQPQAETEASPS
jgi:segregation and condensation protein B